MAAMEEKIIAQRKKKASTGGVSAEQARRFGLKPGQVVSGAERARINRATKTRETIQGAGGTYRSAFDDANLEQQEYERAKREMAQTQAGAGAGAGGPSAADQYVRAIQRMLAGGSFRKPQDELMGKLGEMYGTAQTNVNTAMDALQSSLQGQANPFAGFQAQAAQVSPQLTEFLQSQGASTDPLAQLAAVRQQEASNQAGAFQNVANTLSQIYGANQQGAVGDVAQQRANMLAALEGARAGYGSQVESQATEQQNKLLQLLLQGISRGGRPGRGRLV